MAKAPRWTLKHMRISDERIIHKIYTHYFKYGVVPSKNAMRNNKAALISLAMWCSSNNIVFEHFVEALDGYE